MSHLSPSPQVAQQSVEEQTTGNGRRVRHTTRACGKCRDRRKRCVRTNGEAEACQPCVRAGLESECIFPHPDEDGRSRPDRSTIQDLRTRNALLEQQLQAADEKAKELKRQLRVRGVDHPPERAMTITKLTDDLGQNLAIGTSGGHPESFDPYHSSPSDNLPDSFALHVKSPTEETTSSAGSFQQGGLDLNRDLPKGFLLYPEEFYELIDLFFDCFAYWGLRGHRESFISAMKEALSPMSPPTARASAHYSPMQLNAMLAIAMAFSPDEELNNLDARLKFVRKAQKYVLVEMETPTLSGVLAFSYLSSFFSGVGMRSAASTHFAVCAAMAQVLGLGVDTSGISHMSDWEKHQREWVFWVIFCQDKCLALHFGREMRIPVPKNPRPPVLSHEQDVYKVEMFRCQIRLYLLGTKVLQTIYYGHRVTRNTMIQLFKDVDSSIEEIPAHLRVPETIQEKIQYGRCQLMLGLTHAWVILCQHKPFYRITSSSSRCMSWTNAAVAGADRAAARILQLLRAYAKFYKLHQIHACVIPIAFLAGIIFIYQMERLRNSSEDYTAAKEGLQEIMVLLSTMEVTWKCADIPRFILNRENRRLNPEEATPLPAFNTSQEFAIFAEGSTSFAGFTQALPIGYFAQVGGHSVPEAYPPTAANGSSSINPLRSYHVMEEDVLWSTPGPLSELALFTSTGPINSPFSTTPGAFGTIDFQPASFANSPFGQLGTSSFQPQTGAAMSLFDSPRATMSLLGEEVDLSNMTTTFGNGSGSNGAGSMAPQQRFNPQV